MTLNLTIIKFNSALSIIFKRADERTGELRGSASIHDNTLNISERRSCSTLSVLVQFSSARSCLLLLSQYLVLIMAFFGITYLGYQNPFGDRMIPSAQNKLDTRGRGMAALVRCRRCRKRICLDLVVRFIMSVFSLQTHQTCFLAARADIRIRSDAFRGVSSYKIHQTPTYCIYNSPKRDSCSS